MKKVSKTLALVLALIMVLTISVFAAWPTYQGNDNHDGQIPDGAPTNPTDAQTDPTVINSLALPYCNGNGWSGVDTEPVMQTVGDVTYAYVVYNANTASGDIGGIRLAKVNCSASSPYVVWSKRLATTSGFVLGSPVLIQGSNSNSESDDAIYVGVSGANQVLDDPSLSTLPGQTVWTNSGTGTAASGSITLGVGESYTITQSGFDLAGVASNRVAMGIYVGTSSTTNSAVKVTYTINGNTYTAQNFSSADLIQKGSTGQYYYYLNLNIGSLTPQTTNTISYTVEMTAGNPGSSVVVEYAELFQHAGGLTKITGLDAGLNQESLVSAVSLTGETSIAGQFNTPVTYYTKGSGVNKVEYLYFGTYNGSRSYYEYNLTTDTLTTFTPYFDSPNNSTLNGNFYWAGANVITVGSTDYVVFGSDACSEKVNGNTVKHTYLYYRQVGSFNSSGGRYDLNTLGVTEAGNIRSSISNDTTYIYFTSQGPSSASYAWRVPIANIGGTLSASDVKVVTLSGTSSTSTPAISENGRIYVGYYGGFSAGGVDCIDSTFTSATSICTPGPVQSSVIVYSEVAYDSDDEPYFTGVDYIFVTTNAATGGGYCYSYSGGNSASPIWNTGSGYYSLQGMAASGGYLTFGNDRNQFYVIG